MAKLPRKHQKVFSLNNDTGQIGSAQVGTKILSNDLDVLQALSAFEDGIDSVTLTSLKLMPQEELASFIHMLTYQAAYDKQEGIPEYSAETEYHTNSIVKKAGTYEIYGSVTNSNTGNALTDAANWILLQDLSSGVAQTWTNVLASRTSGATYTNSTGAPIEVAITSSDAIGNNSGLTFYIDGSIILETLSDANAIVPISCVVITIPDGSTYRADEQGTDTFIRWWELR